MTKRLFVAGLPFSTTEEELKNLFAEYGTVISSKIITDKYTGNSKGFGFVEFETEEQAQAAIAKLNDSDYGDRKLVVNEARPMEEKSRPGRMFQSHSKHSRSGQSFGGRREGGRGSFGRNRNGGY